MRKERHWRAPLLFVAATLVGVDFRRSQAHNLTKPKLPLFSDATARHQFRTARWFWKSRNWKICGCQILQLFTQRIHSWFFRRKSSASFPPEIGCTLRLYFEAQCGMRFPTTCQFWLNITSGLMRVADKRCFCPAKQCVLWAHWHVAAVSVAMHCSLHVPHLAHDTQRAWGHTWCDSEWMTQKHKLLMAFNVLRILRSWGPNSWHPWCWSSQPSWCWRDRSEWSSWMIDLITT